MKREALALTDSQLAELRRAAASLPPVRRSEFLEEVSFRLSGEPSDVAVSSTIASVLAVLHIREVR
jgi:hypothetical protein